MLEALYELPESPPRSEKTVATITPPHQFRMYSPGLTAMYLVEWLQETSLETDH